MKTKLLLLPFVLFVIGQSIGQTNLPTVLACNEILTTSGNPYIVDSTITIKPGCTLTVNPGVEIRMAENTHLIVNGKVDFLGTAAQPIYIHAKDTTWGNILLENTVTQKSTFTYVIIENARQNVNINQNPAAIYGINSSLEIKDCFFKNNLRCIYIYQCPNALIKRCTLDSTNVGEKILGQYCNGSIVDSSIFYFTHGDRDVIDFDASNNVTISNNRIYGGDDDGIDIGQTDSIGCNGVTIQGNYIFNMGNKGVSNGEYCVNINVNHNVIVGCKMGIGAKSGAHVIADHNTLYHNRLGINSYHHLNQIWGPGHLTVTNCIISDSDTAWNVDPTAFLSVSYSLAEDTLLPGIGNIKGAPMFYSPAADPSGDFHLLITSAAIDKGDPTFALDPDGSRTDIGRFYLNQNTSVQKLDQKVGFELIYPNPGNGNFTMRLIPDYKMNRLVVLDISGEIVQEKEFFGSRTEYQIDLSSQAAGVYYLKLYGGSGISTQKVIVH